VATLQHRITRAIETALAQASLFEGYEKIGDDFVPLAGREVLAFTRPNSTAAQAEIQF
jgi:hypothetical protein